jgi:hypothetical protein
MDKETLTFSVLLSSTNWGKLPQFSIWLDDKLIVRNMLDNNTPAIKFSEEVIAGTHELKIRLENKMPSDTVLVDSNIVKDMLLNIDDISINEISLGNLLWNGKYTLNQSQQYNGAIITEMDNCVNLGWNGTYSFAFNSPFYLWLLDSL